MRAADRPHHSDAAVTQVAAGSARQALLRLMIAVLATIALLVVWRPTVVHAQGANANATAPAQRSSHVVRAGESLFSLAVRYYGDGNAWTELARLNSIPETASRPLVVGMRLAVPPAKPARSASAPAALLKANASVPKVAVAVAATPRAASAATSNSPVPAAGRSTLAAQTAGKGDAAPTAPRSSARGRAGTRVASAARKPSSTSKSASNTVSPAPSAATKDTVGRSAVAEASGRTPMRAQMKVETPLVKTGVRIGLLEPGASAAARGSEPATIFIRRVPTLEEAQAQARAASRPSEVAPRRGEYEGAPFAVAPARLERAGRIVRRVGAAAAAASKEPQRMLIADEVEITAPVGATLSVGDRLQAIQDRGPLASTDRVAQPGGVLVVTEVAPGKPIVARVQTQSGLLEQGQALLAVSGGPAPLAASGGPASAAAGDQLRTTVRWVENDALLPTLQSYILLSAGTVQGVQAGDEFALVKTRGSANTGEEQRIAVVRVVRSDASGSTAIVVKQDRGEIAPGVAARRVARFP